MSTDLDVASPTQDTTPDEALVTITGAKDVQLTGAGVAVIGSADKPTMAQRIASEQDDDPLAHEWIVAAEVAIDNKTARRASFRGSFRAIEGMRIDALETYCRKCRRPLDDVEHEPCSAKIDNTHLIGGDQSVREKRIKHEPVGPVTLTPITRTGMAGYSVRAHRGH